MARISDYIKNIFFILLILSIAPKLIDTIKNEYMKKLEPHTKVGYLPVNGFISSSKNICNNLKKLLKNSSVKAVLIEIESHGGTPGAGKALFDEISALKKEYPKPIIAYTENICASAAYYLAASTDYIIAPSCAFVGSIGCYFPLQFKLKGFLDKHNIKYNAIQTGDYKTITDPFVDPTTEGNAYMQKLSDDVYLQFTQDIAQARNLSKKQDDVKIWANGKLFTGNEALKLKLIDKTGPRLTAIEEIRKRGIIEGEIRWIQPTPISPFAKLFGAESQGEEPIISSWTHSILGSVCSFLEERYSLTK